MQNATSDISSGYTIALKKIKIYIMFPYGLQPAKSGHANQEPLTFTKFLLIIFQTGAHTCFLFSSLASSLSFSSIFDLLISVVHFG